MLTTCVGESLQERQQKHQKLLDDMLEKINKVSLELARTRPAFRKEIQDKLDMMTANYNMMIDKHSGNKIKSLYVPGPMSEAEKLKLIQLIEST